MSSDDKKIWKKPELKAFKNAAEAIAYYAERGMHEHVAAVKRMAAEKDADGDAPEDRRFRVSSRR